MPRARSAYAPAIYRISHTATIGLLSVELVMRHADSATIRRDARARHRWPRRSMPAGELVIATTAVAPANMSNFFEVMQYMEQN